MADADAWHSGSTIKDRSPITEANIGAIEKENLEFANRLISALEGAIAAYENASEKPPELRGKYESFKRLHEEVSAWLRDMLHGMNAGMTFEERMRMLERFVKIGLRQTAGA
ncbi:MAG: hypothetical protein AB1324_01530 [Candidatus Micrarchaeota archaeon]